MMTLFCLKNGIKSYLKANMTVKTILDDIYHKFNRREYVNPDPLEFLYTYDDIKEREIVGLIAACLAYGRVAQIKKSVSVVLGKMGPSPWEFTANSSPESLSTVFNGFVHRFARGEHISALIIGMKRMISEYGSLHESFANKINRKDQTVFPALNLFAKELVGFAHRDPGHLIPLPERGSAGKRLNLFLRWMVRCDAVDPGGWDGVLPSKLIVPVDVHMHTVCRQMGFTSKKQANMKTALEITRCFKKIAPDDPVKYDFALTRFGIRKRADFTEFFPEKNRKTGKIP